MLTRKLWLGSCALLVFLALVCFWLYRISVLGPDFYQAAQAVSPSMSMASGEKLEEQFLEAHNSAVRQPTWVLVISDDQVNGWIKSLLGRKYPRFRPSQIENLCLDFEKGRTRLAFQLQQALLPIVICIRLVPFITEDERHIAIRLESIRAGIIPLPKKATTDRITQIMQRAKTPIIWTVENGQPVGLLPSRFPMSREIGRTWRVTGLVIAEGRLTLSGTAANSD